MTTCEFREECKKHYPNRIQEFLGEGCGYEDSDELDRCPFRKFAILVVNRTVEKVLDIYTKTPIGLRRTTQMMDILGALKMEED